MKYSILYAKAMNGDWIHIDDIHMIRTPFIHSCPQCGHKCRSTSALEVHQLHVHGIKIKDLTPLEKEAQSLPHGN
jgi:hypothetical protein